LGSKNEAIENGFVHLTCAMCRVPDALKSRAFGD